MRHVKKKKKSASPELLTQSSLSHFHSYFFSFPSITLDSSVHVHKIFAQVKTEYVHEMM